MIKLKRAHLILAGIGLICLSGAQSHANEKFKLAVYTIQFGMPEQAPEEFAKKWTLEKRSLDTWQGEIESAFIGTLFRQKYQYIGQDSVQQLFKKKIH